MGDGHRRRIVLPQAPQAELAAVQLVDAVGGQIELSRDTLAEVKLAVVEACLNALEYGQGRVEVEVMAHQGDPAWIEVVVTDHGSGFKPGEVPHPDLEAKLHSRRKRGWGLELMRHLMDEVEVTSQPGLTRVRMTRRGKEA
jgi:serine/threonine-protein kinase RsbW